MSSIADIRTAPRSSLLVSGGDVPREVLIARHAFLPAVTEYLERIGGKVGKKNEEIQDEDCFAQKEAGIEERIYDQWHIFALGRTEGAPERSTGRALAKANRGRRYRQKGSPEEGRQRWSLSTAKRPARERPDDEDPSIAGTCSHVRSLVCLYAGKDIYLLQQFTPDTYKLAPGAPHESTPRKQHFQTPGPRCHLHSCAFFR